MESRRVLVFAPHPDDEVLGCGGTIARYISEGYKAYVCVVTCGKPPVFDNSIAEKNGWPHTLYPEIVEAHKILGIEKTYFLSFPAAAMETAPRYEVNKKVMEVIEEVKPDTVFIPHFGDMQKDHTAVAESVMVAVRPKYKHKVRYVYSYECLSETEWNIPHAANTFIPNVFIDISDSIDIKTAALGCYKSQLGDASDPRSIESVTALAKLRGSTMHTMYAEAFMLIREYRE